MAEPVTNNKIVVAILERHSNPSPPVAPAERGALPTVEDGYPWY
jgi:hypothetical protein